jgi:hypothetical protein
MSAFHVGFRTVAAWSGFVCNGVTLSIARWCIQYVKQHTTKTHHIALSVFCLKGTNISSYQPQCTVSSEDTLAADSQRSQARGTQLRCALPTNGFVPADVSPIPELEVSVMMSFGKGMMVS